MRPVPAGQLSPTSSQPRTSTFDNWSAAITTTTSEAKNGTRDQREPAEASGSAPATAGGPEVCWVSIGSIVREGCISVASGRPGTRSSAGSSTAVVVRSRQTVSEPHAARSTPVVFNPFRRDPRSDERLEDGRPRLPPGQRLTDGWPVLHYGGIPRIDLATWEFRVFGLVEEELTLNWDEFMALPQAQMQNDIHCVTTWSKFDNDWQGVRFRDIVARVKPLPEAKHVVFHSYGGYTTNVPLDEMLSDDDMLAHTHNGEPLSIEHGWPLRGVIPHLYFWKSAKWVRGMEFVAQDRPGFWEMYGYHMHGDPWTEERYG
ncbi:MAG: molybdopterin-dependent oxidoreductase [Dehalococcoidia bacterium]|nr:molybdopterin-dependent oxidoreductase [Dehalococcoidia bacterium]